MMIAKNQHQGAGGYNPYAGTASRPSVFSGIRRCESDNVVLLASPVTRFRVTGTRLVFFALTIGSALVICSCDRAVEWSSSLPGWGKDLTDELSRLERANRVIVRKRGDTVKDITDESSIRGLTSLFLRHPKHWVARSGVFPDYDLVFFSGGNQLQSLLGISAGSPEGASKSTISVGDYYQRVPAEEVADVAKTLDLVWPLAH